VSLPCLGRAARPRLSFQLGQTRASTAQLGGRLTNILAPKPRPQGSQPTPCSVARGTSTDLAWLHLLRHPPPKTNRHSPSRAPLRLDRRWPPPIQSSRLRNFPSIIAAKGPEKKIDSLITAMGKYEIELHIPYPKSLLRSLVFLSLLCLPRHCPSRRLQSWEQPVIAGTSSRCFDDVLPLPVTPNLPHWHLGRDTHTSAEWEPVRAEVHPLPVKPRSPSSSHGAARCCSTLRASRRYSTSLPGPKYIHTSRPFSLRPALHVFCSLIHPSDSFTLPPPQHPQVLPSLKLPLPNCYNSSHIPPPFHAAPGAPTGSLLQLFFLSQSLSNF
jgi:hypothetical protein